MRERHLIAILTAILRAQQPELDGEAAVLQAIALARGGMGERELADALKLVCQGRDLSPVDIQLDVAIVLAERGMLTRVEQEAVRPRSTILAD